MIEVDGVDESRNVGESSSFQKMVILGNWWLVKCSKEFEGRRFGVGGTELMTSTVRRAMRVFISAPIVKVFDVFTIETADGICINLKGFIDKERTIQSGFSPEIFRHFLFGFPPGWNRVLTNFFAGDSPAGGLDSTSRTDRSTINAADFPILSPCKNKLPTLEVTKGVESDKTTVDDGQASTRSGNEFPCSFLSSPTNNKSGDDARSPAIDTIKTNDNKSGDDFESPAVDTVKTKDTKSGDDVRSPAVDTVKTKDNKTGDDVGSPAVDTIKTKNKSGDDVILPGGDTVKTKDNKSGDDVVLPAGDTVKTKDNESVVVIGLVAGKTVKTKDNKSQALSAITQLRFKDTNKNSKTVDKSISRKSSKSKGGESCVHEDPPSVDSIKRKIDFDTEVTPRKQKRKETNALLSPDSLNLKRSRSGRLLMSPLEFWRNECPVYNAERTLIGIKEDVNVETPMKGSRSNSEPRGRRRKRRTPRKQ